MTKQDLTAFLAGAAAALFLVLAAWFMPGGWRPVEAGAPQTAVPDAFDGVSPYVIPAAAFAADGFDPDSAFFSFGGGYFAGTGAAYGCLTAPVYLPAGVPVQSMFVSVYDNDPGRPVSVALRRVDNFTGSGSTMASVSTTGPAASTSIQVLADATISNPIIRAPDYSYYVTTCLGSSSLRLYSVRLRFGYDLYLPAIRRK